ncbi:MAG: Fic family protein [Actinomycetota bacterium]|nr:Fic family protein [Actinomycetota bacterium]
MKKKTLEPAPRVDLAKTTLNLSEVMGLAQNPLVRDVLRKANSDYLYWDKFKHLPIPKGLDHNLAWFLLKLSRALDRRDTPVVDAHGHVFSYSLTPEVLRCLHVIDQRAGGTVTMESEGIPAENQKRFIVNSLMEEAIASSQIEGASTTTRVAKDMLRTGREPADHAERMILNNYKTIQKMKGYRDKPITPQLLCELQAFMTEGTLEHPEDSGRYRTREDDVVVADEIRLEILHTPPEASQIPAQLQALCDYANNESGDFEYPVLKAIALHFWLAYLHPFVDGNGRTARALFYLFVLKQGYWLFEYLAISRVILGRRGQYDRAYLYSEQDDCDVTYFVTFNLHAIEQSITELHEYIGRKSEEDERLQRSLKRDVTLNHRQRAVLIRALKDPSVQVTIESHASSHDVAYATSRSDLYALADSVYLTKKKSGRQFVFTPASNLRELIRGSHVPK